MMEFNDRWNSIRGKEDLWWQAALPEHGYRVKHAALTELLQRYDRHDGLEYLRLPVWTPLAQYALPSGIEPAATPRPLSSGDYFEEEEARAADISDWRQKIPEVLSDYLQRMFDELKDCTGKLPPDADIMPEVHRLYVNRRSIEMPVEMAVACPLYSGDDLLGFAFRDTNQRFYILDHPVLMRFHGTLNSIIRRQQEPAALLYSARAFEELIERATFRRGDPFDSEDFHDLPEHVLHAVRHAIWKKRLQAGELPPEPVVLANYNRRIEVKANTFVVDTLHDGHVFVTLEHAPSGEIKTAAWRSPK